MISFFSETLFTTHPINLVVEKFSRNEPILQAPITYCYIKKTPQKTVSLSDTTTYWLWWNLAYDFSALTWYAWYDWPWCEVFLSTLCQYLLWETCCKNYNCSDGTFLNKEVKLLSVRHNLKFNFVKMPVFEIHFKISISCFMYILHVLLRNKTHII